METVMTSIKDVKDKEPLSATEARQGVRGMRIFIVLVSALILAALAWAGVEVWGRYIDPGKGPSTSSAPTTPSSTPRSDGAASSQQALPPAATDKSENNQLGIKTTPGQPNRDGTQK
jgi:hypothetical protein